MATKAASPKITYVPHTELRFGHEDGMNFNARRSDQKKNDTRFANSLRTFGIVIPLITTEANGHTYVIAGNRRLAAIRKMADEGTDHGKVDFFHIPTIDRDDLSDTEALEISLVENNDREPLHSVDKFEVFHALKEDGGLTVEEIAQRHGTTRVDVERALALAALSPAVREAWRAGKMSAFAAQAFTLAPSLAAQDRVLKKLLKADWGLENGHQVRLELGVSKNASSARYVAFVGIDAYEAAGGKVTRDLFGTNHVIDNPALAKELADRKLLAECERVAHYGGWKWASVEADLPANARHTFQQLPATENPTAAQKKRAAELSDIIQAVDDAQGEGREYDVLAYEAPLQEREALRSEVAVASYKPASRERSGCILSIGDGGTLAIKPGMVLPQDQVKSPAADKKKKAATKQTAAERAETGEPAGITNALAQRLSTQITLAAGEALAQDGVLALAAVIAALQAGAGPLAIRHSGLRSEEAKDESEASFEEALALKGTPSQQLKRLAGWAAAALDMRCQNAENLPLGPDRPDAAALLEALDPKALNTALRGRWDAPDYFASVAKPVCIQAITECSPKQDMKGVASKPKAEVAALAVELALKAKWLPWEMRVSGYDGPKGKALPKARAAASKKKR